MRHVDGSETRWCLWDSVSVASRQPQSLQRKSENIPNGRRPIT